MKTRINEIKKLQKLAGIKKNQESQACKDALLEYKLYEGAESLDEISSQDELSKEIAEYNKNSAELKKLEASIADTLKKIKDISKGEDTRLKQIINYMQDFKVKQVKADKWVASLEEVAKYSRPQPSYKELWEEALTKLNKSTVEVMKKLEHAQVSEKAKETKPEFKIEPLKENLLDLAKKGINFVVDKIKGLLGTVRKYKDVVDGLPVIKSEVNENEGQIKVGDKIKGTQGVTKDKIGKIISINGDMAQVDFGDGNKYGIVLRRIKDGEFSIIDENKKQDYDTDTHDKASEVWKALKEKILNKMGYSWDDLDDDDSLEDKVNRMTDTAFNKLSKKQVDNFKLPKKLNENKESIFVTHSKKFTKNFENLKQLIKKEGYEF